METRVNANEQGARCWDAARDNQDAWSKGTEEEYWYCLEVLPPIMFAGGFAVSEAIRHNADGRAVYLAVVQVQGVNYFRELTVPQMAAEAEGLRYVLGRNALVRDAAEAEEVFGLDELERYAAEKRGQVSP